jgi:hypothetical protein
MNAICSTRGYVKCIQNFSSKTCDHSGDLGIDIRIILKRIFQDMRYIWTGFIWFKTRGKFRRL